MDRRRLIAACSSLVIGDVARLLDTCDFAADALEAALAAAKLAMEKRIDPDCYGPDCARAATARRIVKKLTNRLANGNEPPVMTETMPTKVAVISAPTQTPRRSSRLANSVKK